LPFQILKRAFGSRRLFPLLQPDLGTFFSINPDVQSQLRLAVISKTPFGKGRQTITDTSVRSAWEIDAGQLSFGNKDWEKNMEQII
jgi:hypothetical protein